MRILHIGLSATGTPLNGLQKALMKIGVYDEINTATPNLNQVICRKADVYRPDLVWLQVQTPNIIAHETAVYLNKIGAFVMNWSGDVRKDINWYAALGRYINLTTFSNVTDVETLLAQGINADYLQIGFDPEIYTPEGPVTAAPDIVFLGNNLINQFPLSPFRIKMVDFLRAHYGPKFGVFGGGWPLSNGTYMGNQAGEAALLRGAKIVINLSHFDYKRYSSDRLHRSLGCGKFILTKWYPEIEKDFVDGEHLVIWKDLDDLKAKLDFYLSNDAERERIAKNAYKIGREKFTFDHMAENIKELYLKHKL